MDIVYSVPDSVGKEISQLPDQQAVEVLQLASKRFREASGSTTEKKRAVQMLRDLKPFKSKKSAVDTVRDMRDQKDTRNKQ